jgi:hypothetical protein
MQKADTGICGRVAVAGALLLFAGAARGEDWDRLPDGSLGRETEFHGVDGVAIPAYINADLFLMTVVGGVDRPPRSNSTTPSTR